MYNRNEFYTLDEIEQFNLNDIEINDLHDLKNKLEDAFYHTSIKSENNLKRRIGYLKTSVLTEIIKRNMKKALENIEKDFKN